MNWIFYILVFWNVFVFLLYGFDKLAAKSAARRVPERVLLGCAFAMGAFGAAAGMTVFRHKTRKYKFTIGVPAAVIVNAAALTALVKIYEKMWL